jgi:hypothetical protein
VKPIAPFVLLFTPENHDAFGNGDDRGMPDPFGTSWGSVESVKSVKSAFPMGSPLLSEIRPIVSKYMPRKNLPR